MFPQPREEAGFEVHHSVSIGIVRLEKSWSHQFRFGTIDRIMLDAILEVSRKRYDLPIYSPFYYRPLL